MITILLPALLLASSLHAAVPPEPASAWVEDAPGGKPEDPGSADRDRFREDFQNRTLDNICRLARLSGDFKIKPGGILGIQIGARRSLRRYGDGRLALVDEEPVKFSVGYSRELVKFSDKIVTGGFFSAGFEGQSTVIRPIKDTSCKALKKILNPLSLKSVVPLSSLKAAVTREDLTSKLAARIAAMEEGEVWKLPVKPSVGWGPNVTVPVGHASFHAHWTFTTSRGESVSLKRLGPNEVRYRLRIDSVKSSDKGFAASAKVSSADMGLDGLFVYSQLISLFNQYFQANLSIDETTAKGREVLLEYVLNPNDPVQMAALVRAAAGDISVFETIKQMLKRTDALLSSDEEIRQGLERLRDEHDDALASEATFAAGDVYERPLDRFHIHVPFLFRYDASKSETGKERIVLLDAQGGEIRIYPAASHVARGFAEIPVLGDLDRYEKSLAVQVYTYKDKDGRRDSPNAVFIEQQAFTREGPWTPNGMLEGVNGVMRYAGMRGAGVDKSRELPLAPFKTSNPPVSTARAGSAPVIQGYEKGMSAFTLILSRKAIADILAAAPDSIAKAYTNALGEAEKAVFTRGPAGFLHGPISRESRGQQDSLRAAYARLTGALSDIQADLSQAREAGDPESQAKAVRDLLAGAGRSGVAYNEILKVLVQFVDPADMAAIAEINVKPNGKEPHVRKRFLLNPGGADSDLIRAYTAARARFLTPSITND